MILYNTKESNIVKISCESTDEDKNFSIYHTTITGNGSDTVFQINHALNTENIIFQMNDGVEPVLIDYKIVNENNISIIFDTAPTHDETYYIMICG